MLLKIRERKISYDLTYMWNLKNVTNIEIDLSLLGLGQ